MARCPIFHQASRLEVHIQNPTPKHSLAEIVGNPVEKSPSSQAKENWKVSKVKCNCKGGSARKNLLTQKADRSDKQLTIYIYIIFWGERSWVSYLCFFLKIITQDSQCKSPGHLGRSVPMVRQCHSLDCTAFGWPSSQGMMWPQARARRFETPGCKGSAPRAWPLLIQTPALPENYVG